MDSGVFGFYVSLFCKMKSSPEIEVLVGPGLLVVAHYVVDVWVGSVNPQFVRFVVTAPRW